MQALGAAQGALRVLQILDGECGVGPEGAPQGDHDVLLGSGGGFQLREHSRGGGCSQGVVGEIVGVDGLLGGLGQAGAWLNAHDSAVEPAGLALEVRNRIDAVNVLRHRPGQARVVIEGPVVLNGPAVLVHVLLVGVLRPRGWVDVDVAGGERGVDRGGVAKRRMLHRVAGCLELIVQQEGGGQALRPRGNVAQRDGRGILIRGGGGKY